MTGILVRLIVRVLLGCIGIVLVALGVGHLLPPEDEIIYNGSYASVDLHIYRLSIGRHLAVPLSNSLSKESLVGWSHDGQQIAFISESQSGSGIYLMDAFGREIQPLTHDLYPIKNPVWSPDNQYIAYISGRDDYPQLRLLDLQTLDVRPLTDASYAPDSPTWSPDGTQIAFVSDTPLDSHINLYTIHLKTGHVSLVAKINDFNLAPSWSPDGSKITFVSYISDGRQFDIYSMDIATGTLKLLATDAAGSAWSPDGQYLLYLDHQLSSMILYDRVREEKFVLYTYHNPFLGRPSWSPNGQYIVYASVANAPSNIYRLNVAECLQRPDGCTPEPLLVNGRLPLYDTPRWRPLPP